jgi:hypothetical protein
VARPGLEAPQPEPLLELPARLLGAWTVVVHAGLAAVLGNECYRTVGLSSTASPVVAQAAGDLAVVGAGSWVDQSPLGPACLAR